MQTFTGAEYLKIDIASNFGLDMDDWDDRIAWVDRHETELEKLQPAAKEPALYFAGVQAYRTMQKGEPIGYPISLDAASSGLQLLACLSGCWDSARLCGVVSTGHREDAYTNIYRFMCQKTEGGMKIERKDTKRAIMTSLYTSTKIPKEVFGEGRLLEIYHQTMEEEAPGAWALNFALQGLWQPYAPSHDWVLPDNFHVHVKVEDQVQRFVQFLDAPVAVTMKVNRGTKEGRSISPNIVHSIDGLVVREMHRRCSYDRSVIASLREVLKQGSFGSSTRREQDRTVQRLWSLYLESGFLSARILENLDRRNLGLVDPAVIGGLLATLPSKSFPMISVHDCFRVHPNYGNDLRRQYNQILSEIAASDMLAFIASQVTGSQITVTKAQDISKDVLQADYALA